MQTATTAGIPKARPRISAGRPMRRIANVNRKSLVGLGLLLPVVVLAVLAPYLPIPGPLDPNPAVSLQGPSLDHPFGTDRLGRDIFARTLGGRASRS